MNHVYSTFEIIKTIPAQALHFIWPPLPTEENKPQKIFKSTLLSVASEVFTEIETPSIETKPLLEPLVIPFYVSLNYIVVPHHLFFHSVDQGFFKNAIAINSIRSKCEWYYPNELQRKNKWSKEPLNLNWLETYDILPKGDAIDQCLHEAITNSLLSGVNLITDGKIEPYLKVTAVFTSIGFIQNSVINFPGIREFNIGLHQFTSNIREIVKSVLIITMTNQAKKFLTPHLKKIDQKIEQQEKKFKETATNRIGSFAVQILEYFLEDQIKTAAFEVNDLVIDNVLNAIGDAAVNGAVSLGKSSMQFYFINQALKNSVNKHPFFAAGQLILSGGLSQSFTSLISRIIAVTLLLFKKSTLYPILILQSGKVFETFLKIRARRIHAIEQKMLQYKKPETEIDYFAEYNPSMII